MRGALPLEVNRLVVLVCLLVSPGVRADECERVEVWSGGHRTEAICRRDAAARGLTVVDLADDWTPPVLAPGPDYRDTYLALAAERDLAPLAAHDRYFELYGIPPSLGVVRARLADDARHRCHDDAGPVKIADRIVEESAAGARARISLARAVRAELEADQRRAKLETLDELAARDGYHRRAVARLAALEARIAAIRAAQAHLACDDLLETPPIDGAYTWHTSDALERFQRGVMVLPTGALDAVTADALSADSRERDLLTALRVLRERVAAAAGLVEDGTAGAGVGTVLGRVLEPETTWRVRGHGPLDGAAPDLLSPATEAAARALGWTDAASVLAFLAPDAPHVVAVALPAVPAYHAAQMDLSVEIDRGDVWLDPVPRARSVARRPALVLYATDGARRIPLARWPTTIGGWQKQKEDDDIVTKWKDSPVGARIWRDLYVGPRWLPPKTTPDRELVRRIDGRSVLATELLGPSYRAAFGMVAFVHLVPDKEPWDQGIRTHGTGSLSSLATGVSHGCHRLLGFHVVRLADFVLAHRTHVRRGETPTTYRRVVRDRGTFRIAIDSLGYRIELDPPVPVTVLPGRIHR